MAQVDRDRLWQSWPGEHPQSPDDAEGFSPLRAAVPFVAIGLIASLGVVFWMLIGSLFGALLGTRESLSGVQLGPPRYHLTPTVTPRPTLVPLVIGPGALTPILLPSIVATPPTGTPTATVDDSATPTAEPTPSPGRTATVAPTLTSTPGAPTRTPGSGTPTPTESGRDPWVLLPLPEPGSRVTAGTVAIEARGRGDAPIREIRLEVDGRPLAVEMDQRSDVIWRGRATANLGPGTHEVRARVVDANGRTGGYRWTIEVVP